MRQGSGDDRGGKRTPAGPRRPAPANRSTDARRSRPSPAPRSSALTPRSASPAPSYLLESEVLRGIKPFAVAELRERLGDQVKLQPSADEESLPFEYTGDLRRVLRLRTVVDVSLVGHYEIPRPSALLGHQNLTDLLAQIDIALGLHPAGGFSTFRISAAGEESPVFLRLRDEIAAHTGLTYRREEADLLLRVRRAPGQPEATAQGAPGWDVLVRLTPRPLSTRPWRLHNVPGSLNATVAAAIVELTRPRPIDRLLNPFCGSGTLLIERLLRGPARVAVGCDVDPAALETARDHLRAARLEGSAELREADATRLGFPDGSFDVVCADLPWGQLVGSHRSNAELYPAFLAEAHRVAAPRATLALLTHEIDLLEGLLPGFADRWKLEQVVRVFQGGLHPRIYLLRKAT